MATTQWSLWKNVWVARTALPGIWKRREGGFVIHGKATDPRSGKRKEVHRVLLEADQATAYKTLHDELEAIRRGNDETTTRTPRFTQYAASLFETRVAKGKIKSAATRELWESILRLHIFEAPFADYYVDAIRRADIDDWVEKVVAPKVTAGRVAPVTANTWLRILKTIVNGYVGKYQLPLNPIAGVEPFDTRGHRPYTVEQPNALTPDELSPFLATFNELYPQLYAFVVLGFTTGMRPSTLRPLRRAGVESDVLWAQKAVLVRRSHTRGQEVMNFPKTAEDQRLPLDEQLVAVLHEHTQRLPWRRQQESELLFPSRVGGYLARSILDKPFAEVCARLKLTKHITARGMRRTHKNLMRAANISDAVAMAFSGHETEEMHLHYSSVPEPELRDAVAKVVRLVDFQHKVRAAS